MRKLLSYYNQIILGLLIIVINLYYHPLFHVARADVEDADEKSVLSKYVLLLAGMLVLPNIRISEWKSIQGVKKIIKYLIPLMLIAAIVHVLAPASKILSDSRYFFIPSVFFILGFQFKLSEKKIMFFSLLYVSFALFTGVSQVLTNIGSFAIMEQYMVTAKNSMACIFAIGILVSLFWALSDISKFYKIAFFGIFIMLFTVLFTIRGRAGILASVLSCAILIYKYIKTNNIAPSRMFLRVLMTIVTVLVILLISGKLMIVWDYIYSSFFLSHNGDITSGRTDRNLDALDMIAENILTGRILSNSQIDWVHNYILRVLSDYGILVGGYLLVPYFYLIRSIRRNIKEVNKYSILLLGNVALIIPFVISLFEPTFPYNPGTTIMFAYFLYGVSNSFKFNNTYETLLCR